MSPRLFFRLSVLALILLPVLARAQWQLNGLPVSTAASYQEVPAMVSDGADGAIITWHDLRAGNYDVYVQRVTRFGTPQWTASGTAICALAGDQAYPTLIADGAGGAFVTWHDLRSSNPDIYIQRVNAAGVAQWTADGVALCTAASEQSFPQIVSDGSGGAIVTWQDNRSGNYDIYAQRVNGAGSMQWTDDGVALIVAPGTQRLPTIIAGNAGAAIVAWEDYQFGDSNIRAQRVSSTGALLWGSVASGLSVTAATEDQVSPALAPDGGGGAIFVWEDWRISGYGVYAQHVSQAGGGQWEYAGNLDGVPLSSNVATDFLRPKVIADGAGGAIATWTDLRSAAGIKAYVQRINGSGAPQWTTNGVLISPRPGSNYYPVIVADGIGGVLVAWQDTRAGNFDVYAQRLDLSADAKWDTGGVALCTSPNEQSGLQIFSDGSGSAIIAWQDRRGGSWDIYAQRVEFHGFWGHPEPWIVSVTDVPMDQGGRLQVTWAASQWDLFEFDTITHYSLWREFASLASLEARGSRKVDPRRIPSGFQGTVHRTDAGPRSTSGAWEFIATVPVRYATQYRYTVTTLSDSLPGDPRDETFQVLAHVENVFHFFVSNAVSGHSTDNLSPGSPFFLSAQRLGADVHLRWTRVAVPDLRDYAVYRGSGPGVTPVPGSFIGSASDTVLVDAGAPAGALYYIVTAYDVHANQSAPSNELNVSGTTAVGSPPAVVALTVLPNFPNPFRRSTELRIGLPERSDVALELYDVAGRRVARRVWGEVAAGWQRLSFEALDDRSQRLAAGVYSYRVTAAGATSDGSLVVLE